MTQNQLLYQQADKLAFKDEDDNYLTLSYAHHRLKLANFIKKKWNIKDLSSRKARIVSVIGFQKAGKSFLINQLFHPNPPTREGPDNNRTTLGADMYEVKFDNKDIFVLDSEGVSKFLGEEKRGLTKQEHWAHNQRLISLLYSISSVLIVAFDNSEVAQMLMDQMEVFESIIEKAPQPARLIFVWNKVLPGTYANLADSHQMREFKETSVVQQLNKQQPFLLFGVPIKDQNANSFDEAMKTLSNGIKNALDGAEQDTQDMSLWVKWLPEISHALNESEAGVDPSIFKFRASLKTCKMALEFAVAKYKDSLAADTVLSLPEHTARVAVAEAEYYKQAVGGAAEHVFLDLSNQLSSAYESKYKACPKLCNSHKSSCSKNVRHLSNTTPCKCGQKFNGVACVKKDCKSVCPNPLTCGEQDYDCGCCIGLCDHNRKCTLKQGQHSPASKVQNGNCRGECCCPNKCPNNADKCIKESWGHTAGADCRCKNCCEKVCHKHPTARCENHDLSHAFHYCGGDYLLPCSGVLHGRTICTNSVKNNCQNPSPSTNCGNHNWKAEKSGWWVEVRGNKPDGTLKIGFNDRNDDHGNWFVWNGAVHPRVFDVPDPWHNVEKLRMDVENTGGHWVDVDFYYQDHRVQVIHCSKGEDQFRERGHRQ